MASWREDGICQYDVFHSTEAQSEYWVVIVFLTQGYAILLLSCPPISSLPPLLHNWFSLWLQGTHLLELLLLMLKERGRGNEEVLCLPQTVTEL